MDVLTAHPSSLLRTDDARLRELPVGTRVYGVTMPTSLPERLEKWGLKRWRAAGERQRSSLPTSSKTSAHPSPEGAKAGSLGALEIQWHGTTRVRSSAHIMHWSGSHIGTRGRGLRLISEWR